MPGGKERIQGQLLDHGRSRRSLVLHDYDDSRPAGRTAELEDPIREVLPLIRTRKDRWPRARRAVGEKVSDGVRELIANERLRPPRVTDQRAKERVMRVSGEIAEHGRTGAGGCLHGASRCSAQGLRQALDFGTPEPCVRRRRAQVTPAPARWYRSAADRTTPARAGNRMRPGGERTATPPDRGRA